MKKFIDMDGLMYFSERIKQYIDMKIELSTNKSTNCPNCGAPITSSKCEYCGTDFEKSIIW